MKAKGKKYTALAIIILLVALSGNLFAKKKGAELIIQKTDGQQIQGELIAVKENSLLVMESLSLNDLTIKIDDVKIVTILGKSRFWRGAGFGFLMGSLGAMMVTGFLFAEKMGDMAGGSVSYGAIGGAVGAVVGGLVGKKPRMPEIIEVEGKSDSEIKEILEILRSRARVPEIE